MSHDFLYLVQFFLRSGAILQLLMPETQARDMKDRWEKRQDPPPGEDRERWRGRTPDNFEWTVRVADIMAVVMRPATVEQQQMADHGRQHPQQRIAPGTSGRN